MLGSDILDVVVSLSFIFFLLSIVASAGQELVSQAISWRSKSLKDGIKKMLGDPTFTALAKEVYDHPLIKTLGAKGPSYLSNDRFADSLIESLNQTKDATK